jgi:hypothetical protein
MKPNDHKQIISDFLFANETYEQFALRVAAGSLTTRMKQSLSPMQYLRSCGVGGIGEGGGSGLHVDIPTLRATCF